MASDYGACCACGGRRRVRNIVMLDFAGPVPGHGWGCVVCGLPCDGAVAFLCDGCIRRRRPAVMVSAGGGKRVSIESLARVPFAHDLARHGDGPAAR